MQLQIDELHTKIDLVLGGISLILDKTQSTIAPTTTSTTPPHYIGQLPSAAVHHTPLPPFQFPLPPLPPFPFFAETTPSIDMSLYVSAAERGPECTVTEEHADVIDLDYAELVDQPVPSMPTMVPTTTTTTTTTPPHRIGQLPTTAVHHAPLPSLPGEVSEIVDPEILAFLRDEWHNDDDGKLWPGMHDHSLDLPWKSWRSDNHDWTPDNWSASSTLHDPPRRKGFWQPQHK